MKRILLTALTVGSVISMNAQVNTTLVGARYDRNSATYQKVKPNAGAKAEGDLVFSDDFSTPSNWTFTNEPSHTAGDWTIVNAVPGSLVSQAPTYGFPTAMLSTSGGNFGFIDSDGAGNGAVQNALLTTANPIDVAAQLVTNGSAANVALYLEFTEIYRHYQESFFVEVSNDNGATWTQFQVNPPAEVPVNTNSGNPEVETVNITSTIGAGNWGSQVKIRFRYQGTYDWFWGVDDVRLIEAYANDIKVSSFYQATDIMTTQALDYYMVPESQTSFPGITFGANIFNKGGDAQPDVALNAVAPSYDETGATVSIASGAVDTLSITVPYMLPSAVGNYAIAVTTDMANTDADPSNNVTAYSVRRDEYLYSRDDGTATGSISNVTSNTDLELRIGNVMEIFDDMEISNVQLRLVNQATAVGQVVNAEIWYFDGGTSTFVYGGQTEDYTITNADLGNFIVMPIDNGTYSAAAGDVLLVMAHHFGGTNEVAFGYAQNTFEGTVLGFADQSPDLFQLTDPNAIMIRLSDEPLGIEENALNAEMTIYPNPASDKATVSFEVNNVETASVVVTDLSGKVINTVAVSSVLTGTNNVEINTANMAAGVYNVVLQANGSSVTKKMVVRK